MKICVYTCITGGYDRLQQPACAQNPDIDFICFSDKPGVQDGIWQIRQIPPELRYLSNVKKQRVVKICPHRWLREYDISVWVDGNIRIIGDISKFIDQYDVQKTHFFTRVHPSRNCIYDEAAACARIGKDSSDVIEKQISKYKANQYPRHAGMVETCIILRKHNEKDCVMLDNAWATELLENSCRD